MHRYAFLASISFAVVSPAFAEDPAVLDVPAAKENFESYVGQRIRLTGGHVSSVKPAYDLAVYGEYGKPTLPIDTAGADTDTLSALAASCSAMNTTSEAACACDVVATMTKDSKGRPQLVEPEFIRD